MAVGHSGTSSADTLDSSDRGSQFAARTAGLPGLLSWLFPQESVGDAWMDTGTIDRIVARTARGGAEITELVGTSAWYAPGASVVEMVEAILLDKKKILSCSVFLQGEYGVRDLFVGVPCKLGARGLEKIIEIKLTSDEEAAFSKSAAAVKELVEVIKV